MLEQLAIIDKSFSFNVTQFICRAISKIRTYKLDHGAKDTFSKSIIEKKLLMPNDCKYLSLDQEKQKIMIF